jgi:hypothetical protein
MLSLLTSDDESLRVHIASMGFVDRATGTDRVVETEIIPAH